MSSPFIDSTWLASHLSSPDVCIIDASWHLPNVPRDATAEYHAQHIPGAVYFDLDKIADTSIDLPHMIADEKTFSRMVGELGIRETNTIIIYDSYGLFSAARVWWNFKIMGAQNVYVLKGGLPKWKEEGRPLSNKSSLPLPRPFIAKQNPDMVVSRDEIEANLALIRENKHSQIVDLRPNMRFAGLQPEPRPGLQSGFMPGSINLPFDNIVQNGQLIDSSALLTLMHTVGIDLDRPVISSCGSGVTAPIFNLALAELGIDAMRVYDGSWAEWGMNNGLPVIGGDGNLVTR